MKKLSINSDEAMSSDDEENCVLLLAGINALYLALKSGRPFRNPPKGLERVLAGDSFERIKAEVAGANRMSAGIQYLAIGPWAEIRVCEGQRCLKAMTICFDVANQAFLIVAE